MRHKQSVRLEPDERARLEAAFGEIRRLPPRSTIVRAGAPLNHATLLLEGFLACYIDDRAGLRQLVAVNVPGDIVDLHAYAFGTLDHDVATMTAVAIATVPHAELDAIARAKPSLTQKLWFATLVDAAVHRAWLFRLGRLDATGRVAHFLCETNARLVSAGLSDGYRFTLGMTQTDLAEICGLTTVHVNRVLRHLRQERLCVFRSSQVEIIDSARLAERAQFDPAYLYIDTAPVPMRPELEMVPS